MAWLRMWRTHRSNTCLSLASAFTLLLKYLNDDPVWRAFRFSERHDRLELIRHVTAHAIVLDAVEPDAAVYPGCDVTWELLVRVGIITLLGHGKRCTRRGQDSQSRADAICCGWHLSRVSYRLHTQVSHRATLGPIPVLQATMVLLILFSSTLAQAE
jgi:hypothetical protein